MFFLNKKILLAVLLLALCASCNAAIPNAAIIPAGSSWQTTNNFLPDKVLNDGFAIKTETFFNNSNSDWMGNLSGIIGNMKLRELVLPGTHDSGTYAITEKSDIAPDSFIDVLLADIEKLKEQIHNLPFFRGKPQDSKLNEFISKWGKSQSKTTYEQLQGGIRYFDLRLLQKNDGQMFLVHGMYSVNIDSVINDVSRFIKEHPKEIIILDFNHLYNMKSAHETLFNKLNTSLTDILGKSKLIPRSQTVNQTLNELWKGNQQVIVIYDDKETVNKHPELWSQDSIFSPWPNKQNTDDLKSSLQKILDGNLFNLKKSNFECSKSDNCEKISKNKFFVLQGVLTADTQVIFNSFSGFYSLQKYQALYDNCLQELNNLNYRIEDLRNQYQTASFYKRTVFAIAIGTLEASRKIKKTQLSIYESELLKAKTKYKSNPNSLEDFAYKTTPVIRNLINSEWSGKDINIIITDWFEITDIVEVIKSLNINKAQQRI